MSKRRVFDIDFPGEAAPETKSAVPAGTGDGRRGPMAAAITENAEALRNRAETERAIREENDRLAHEHVRLKRAGLVTDLIPIAEIRTTKLIRDRSAAADPEIEELMQSIRDVGLSNPIRVEATKSGYELIQGFRRLSAFRALHAETGDEKYALIPAGISLEGDDDLAQLYRRMVDENMVRKDLSFAEMAQLALACVAERRADYDTLEAAIAGLYASAGRQKRNYILHFATMLDAIGANLTFPEAIPRRLGLDLDKALDADPGLADVIAGVLNDAAPEDAEAEMAALRSVLDMQARGAKKPARSAARNAAKTTLSCTVPAGTVRCAARDGRVELRMARDFSVVDRHRLETAIAAFMAALDD